MSCTTFVTGPGGSQVGAKALGLLALPDDWTPPFVALDSAAVKTALNQGLSAAAARQVRELAAGAARRLLVRSDSAAEALHPGKGRTVVSDANPAAVSSALADIASSDRSRPAAVVQVAVEPALVGVLSNERRIAEHPSDWLVEGELALRRPGVRKIRAADHAPSTLDASSPSEALDALRAVARHFQDAGGRWRVEWLWDSHRIWVVQADRIPDAPQGADALGSVEPATEVLRGRLRGTSGFPGRKLDRWKTFERLDLPRVDLLVIDGARYRGSGRRDLLDALGRLGQGPVVVRTDLAVTSDPLLLPTSGPTSRPADAMAFMQGAAERFAEAGLADRDWAFLIASLVPAQASAWVCAADQEETTIDALWGYPDGLLHLPHDSYTVAIDGTVISRQQFKPARLLAQDGAWVTRPVPPPFDWQRVLNDEEAQSMAALARRVAAAADGPVQLMILARVGGRRGPDALHPFHFTRLESKRRSPRSISSAASGHAILRRPEDLKALAAGHALGAVRVDPDPDVLRDAGFLGSIGAWAAPRGVAILFAGSRLGHAFHLLSDAGAAVITPADQPTDDEPWCAVVAAGADGLERVRSFPCQQAKRLAARTLAALTILPHVDSDYEDHARRALAVLDPGERQHPVPNHRFRSLGWLRTDEQPPSRSGTVSLFTDATDRTSSPRLRRAKLVVQHAQRRGPDATKHLTHPLTEGWELRVDAIERQTVIRVEPIAVAA